jgi:hypothetical protein
LRAITAIHSRVRIAVFPACSIKAPNQSSTSTALPRAAEVALFSRSDDEVTRGPERDVPDCHISAGDTDRYIDALTLALRRCE